MARYHHHPSPLRHKNPITKRITKPSDLEHEWGRNGLLNLVLWTLNRRHCRPRDFDDGVEYVLAKVKKSIPKWDASKSKFAYFVTLVADRASMSWWRMSTRNGTLMVFSDTDDEVIWRHLESIPDPGPSPSASAASRELAESVRWWVDGNLTQFEKMAAANHMAGRSYAESAACIRKALGRPVSHKAIDNAMHRIREKGIKWLAGLGKVQKG